MTEGSIISIGVRWLMAADCSQVSEKKSFSLGSSFVIPPSAVSGTAGVPIKVNEDEAPFVPGSHGVCAEEREREELSAGIPPLVPNPLRRVWQDPGRNHMAEGRDWNI